MKKHQHWRKGFNAFTSLNGVYKSPDGDTAKNAYWNLSFTKNDVWGVPKPDWLEALEKTILSYKSEFTIKLLTNYTNTSIINKIPTE